MAWIFQIVLKINHNVEAIYTAAVEKYGAENLILMGDSAGGHLVCTLVQRLIAQKKALPKKIIPITPVVDARVDNPEIPNIDVVDPMLSQSGLQSAKLMVANGLDLEDPRISPLFGKFEGFPPTLLFIGGRDILSPDGRLAAAKMQKAKVDLTLIEEAEMPHIWPLLPLIQESAKARKIIAEFILE